MSTEKNVLQFDNLYYEVVNSDKKIKTKYARIIDGLSGKIESGKITAVMGSSGCGKTHFFDMIIGTISSDAQTYGNITYNGQPREWGDWIKKIAFLPQDDVYYPDLTLYESIMFALDFDDTKDMKEKEDLANEVMRASMVYDKKNAQIKTLSGGERKRAMIAITLINQPDILILDEPTTGLDSNSALKIVSSLKKYAEDNNKIVIVTVHQPGEGLFNLFEDLIFLTKGGLFYMGRIADVKDFLIENNIEISDRVSLAEFLFLLHSHDEDEYINLDKYYDTIKDIESRNAPVNRNVEMKSCNNNKVFTLDFSIKHSFLLLKQNLLLLYKSPSLTYSLILFLTVSGMFLGCSYLKFDYYIAQGFDAKDYTEAISSAAFSTKYSLAQLIFLTLFLTQVIFYGIMFSIDMTDIKMLRLNLFHGKFSAFSYLFYQFLEKCLCSLFFITCDFIFNIILLRNSSIPISIYAITYLVAIVYIILFTISYMVFTVLPLGPKMRYTLLLLINILLFWPSTEVKYLIYYFFKRMSKPIAKMMIIGYFFPHINYDTILDVNVRKLYVELKEKSSFLKDLFKFFKYDGLVKTAVRVDVYNLNDSYTNDSEFAYKLYDFVLTHKTVTSIFILSLISCIGLTAFLFRLIKVPNIRTKLSIR